MTDERSNISLIGLSGAACQVLGTIIYTKSLTFIPIFDFFPKLIACLLFLLSGILWTIEILTEDLPPEAPSRSHHIQKRFRDAFRDHNMHTLNTLAGLIAISASVLGLLALYITSASVPLFWASNFLIIACCVGWYLGSTPPKGQSMSTSDRLNQLAAIFQALAIAFMVTATYIASPLMSYSDLSCALFSGIVWAISYCIPNDHDTRVALMIESIHGVISPQVFDHEKSFKLDAVVDKPCTNNPYLPWGYVVKRDGIESGRSTAVPLQVIVGGRGDTAPLRV